MASFRVERVSCLLTVVIVMALLGVTRASTFFRVVGPVPTAIISTTADGSITWTNVATNATFTIQMAESLGATAWHDFTQVNASNAQTTHRLFKSSAPPGMAFIPAGTFIMGDSRNELGGNASPVRTITLSAFFIDKYEVTSNLWNDIYTWATNHGYSFDNAGQSKGPNHPIEKINWWDAIKWCNARSEREGKPIVYYSNASFSTVCRTGQANVYPNWAAAGYRLPTEAEWERAARAGEGGHRFPWIETETISHARANYYSSSVKDYDTNTIYGHHPAYNDGVVPFTAPVGQFPPNRYGLFDMAGNVREWCWDAFSSYSTYPSSQTNPTGVGSSFRLTRGGDSGDMADLLMVGYRFQAGPGFGYISTGFRTAMPAGP